jgi:hypothetical protein
LRRRAPPELVLALVLVLVARTIGLAVGGVLWTMGLIPAEAAAPDHVYLDVEPVSEGFAGWALGVWQRLDTSYYLQIALHGYSADDGTVVFPPLYPLLIRLAGAALGHQYLLAALLISTACSVGLLALLHRFAQTELGHEAATRALAYQIFFPSAYVLIAGYAEPLMLLLAMLALLWARQDRWALSGLAAFLATLARLQAVVLVLPLGWIYLRSRGATLRSALRPALLALAAPPGAALAHSLYLAWRGLPSVSAEFASHWYSTVALPGTDLVVAMRELLTSGLRFQRALPLVLVALFLVLTFVALRRLPKEYGLYMAGILLYSLARHDLAGRPLLSVSRHVLVAFPGFMILGAVGRRPWLHRLILYASSSLCVFLMGAFFLWGYVE